MQKKSKKPKPQRRRGPYVPPPDHRWRDWRRSVLVLFLGLLLPCLWFAGDQVWRHHQKSVVAAHASTAASTAPQALPGLPPSLADREEATQAGRALGFLHTVGSIAFCVLTALIPVGIHFLVFERDPDAGPLFVTWIGAILIACAVSAMLWRYAYVPLVDLIWEACGGRMVPYQLSSSSRSSRGHGGISDHKWGENAALLCMFGLFAIASTVSKLKDAARTGTGPR